MFSSKLSCQNFVKKIKNKKHLPSCLLLYVTVSYLQAPV